MWLLLSTISVLTTDKGVNYIVCSSHNLYFSSKCVPPSKSVFLSNKGILKIFPRVQLAQIERYDGCNDRMQMLPKTPSRDLCQHFELSRWIKSHHQNKQAWEEKRNIAEIDAKLICISKLMGSRPVEGCHKVSSYDIILSLNPEIHRFRKKKSTTTHVVHY